MNKKHFYTRYLPHWQPEETTFIITYRLAGSLPVEVINELKQDYLKEKQRPENQVADAKDILREKYFLEFDSMLAKNLNQPHWLANEQVAQLVLDSLLFNNNKTYTLWSACIMSNHVHIMITTMPQAPLLNIILQNHKKFTAVQGNKLLGRNGKFWAEESFDTIIRNEKHFSNALHYILQNPVKAGLVNHWKEYKWTYLHPELWKNFSL